MNPDNSEFGIRNPESDNSESGNPAIRQSGNATIAVWAITDRALDLAGRLAAGLDGAVLFAPATADVGLNGVRRFKRLGRAVAEAFAHHRGHVFVMAAGIVVRVIAPLLRHKTEDPAVVVMDEAGRWAVSLVSGHIGGANRLAVRVAGVCGAQPVITTATDIRQVPAVDLLAAERGLTVENPDAIKTVAMHLLDGGVVGFHDPRGWMADALPDDVLCRLDCGHDPPPEGPGVFVDDRLVDLPERMLVLRPPSLVAGVGCNRGTGAAEIRELLGQVLARHRLSPLSLKALATIDIKRDEAGLTAAARDLRLPLLFFDRVRLERVEGVTRPSATVQRHVGVHSVCEASAILGAGPGTLIVPKHKSANVTVAIARRASISSASDPEVPSTSLPGRPRS